MEPEGSLPHSQQPDTCPYSEPERFSPRPTSNFLRSNLILSSHLSLGLISESYKQKTKMRTTAELQFLVKYFHQLNTVSLHVQCTGHTRVVSPTPPGPVRTFSPLQYTYRNHVASRACNSNSSTVVARRTCAACFTSACRQCGLPFSCLHHNQLHYVQRTDTAGPVESLTAPHKRTGCCKQAGGVMTDVRNAVNCLSERKHKCEGRQM
jgi:hypothetical protein